MDKLMNDKKKTPKIGKDLLNMLMLQLYSNPRCIYREYIQNSLDAINKAVETGVLSNAKDGHVVITIDKSDIYIEDNGTGIGSDKAPSVLMDIANSWKNGIDTAGQFGIGRLSGGGYCQSLEFETSAKGDCKSAIVAMDIEKLHDIIDDELNEMSAEEAMTAICNIEYKPVDVDKHYFKVHLRNVVNSSDILLNKEDVLAYIRQTAPIDYSALFYSFINGSNQTNFAVRHKAIDKIRVSVNDVSDVEKSYGIKVKGSGDDISKIRYFELPEHPKFGKMAWGWYAVTPFTIAINETNDENVGIRLRKHNISLDKNILDSLFRESRSNKYFYGEIFIDNDNIMPDSGRQGLAAGEEADAFKGQLKSYFSNVLCPLYTKANKLKNSLKKIGEKIERIDTAKEPAAIKILSEDLAKAVDAFKNIVDGDVKDEIRDIHEIYNDKYEKEYSSKVASILENNVPSIDSSNSKEKGSSTNEKSGGTSREATNAQETSESSKDKTTPSTSDKTYDEESLGKSTSSKKGTTKTETSGTEDIENGTNHESKTVKPKKEKSLDEILKVLTDNKEYTVGQVALLRKVLGTMTLICSNSNKANLMKLIDSAVNAVTII